MTGKHTAELKPLRIWSGGELVELPPAGRYVHPRTGHSFYLEGGMGWHTGPGYSATGWPLFWKELVPIETVA